MCKDKKLLMAGMIICLSLLCVSCILRKSPIYNINAEPVLVPKDKNATLSQIEDCILAGGANRGWVMDKVRPGLITGTVKVRTHKAEVEIPYDEKYYGIIYKDSVNLHYDGTYIHGQYNNWIKYLDQSIKKEMILRLK